MKTADVCGVLLCSLVQVTDVLQMDICISADVHYVSFIEIEVTLFIDRTKVLRFL